MNSAGKNNWINWQNYLFNSMTLKTLALITMIIDHVGFLIYPDLVPLRITGRIALPIYTFLIAFGFEKTRNSGLYFLKFFLMFIILQVPTTWYLYLQQNPPESPFYMNIFANLALGSAFIFLYQKHKIYSLLYFVVILVFLIFIQKYEINILNPQSMTKQRFTLDYGIFGFLLIPGFWMGREIIKLTNQKKKTYQNLLINLTAAIFLIIMVLCQYFFFWKIDPINAGNRDFISSIEPWALVDIPLILLFTEYRFHIKSVYVRNTIKYFFWLSYPLTIGITTLIASAIT